MNYARVILGGVVGGIVFNAVSMVINVLCLAKSYAYLQEQDIFLREPRLPFLPLYMLLLILVSIGLVWIYAAARSGLGPGPMTAICVGLVVGLISAAPGFLSGYAWTHAGGYVNFLWAVEKVVGSVAATLAGGWLYKE